MLLCEGSIFYTTGCIGSQPVSFGLIKGLNPLDQPNGANRNQILLIGNLGVVFLKRIMLAECFSGVYTASYCCPGFT